MKELVIFDVDETIVDGQSQRIFLQYLLSNHQIKKIFYFKLMVWFFLYKMGVVKNPIKPMKYAVSFIKGKSVAEIASWSHIFFQKVLINYIYRDAVELIKNHQQMGREVILVSNAIEPIIKEIALHLNILNYFSTTLEIVDGNYSGEISESVYGDNKVDIVRKFIQNRSFDLKRTWAYADHISDKQLLSIVSNPVATNPSSALSAFAEEMHWPSIKFHSVEK